MGLASTVLGKNVCVRLVILVDGNIVCDSFEFETCDWRCEKHSSTLMNYRLLGSFVFK